MKIRLSRFNEEFTGYPQKNRWVKEI